MTREIRKEEVRKLKENKRNNISSTSNHNSDHNNISNSNNKLHIWREWINNKGAASKRTNGNIKYKRKIRISSGSSILRRRGRH